MALTTTLFQDFLKEYWFPGSVEELIYKDHPLLAMVPKNTEVGGEYWAVPIDLDDGADGSPTFADAQTAAANTSSLKRQFQVSYVEDFQVARVDNKVIRLSRDNPRLALEKAAAESKRAKRILSSRIARNLYRNGYGVLGRVTSSSFAVKTFTVNALYARNFRIGQMLQFAADDDSGAMRDSGDYVSVTAINVDTGTITTDAPTDLATSITSIAQNDYVILKGARHATAASKLCLTGLQGWLPDTAPTAGDSFFGVDRSTWPSRLAGIRYACSAGPIEQQLIDALVHMGNHECYPTHLFLDPNYYGRLLKAQEGKVIVCREPAKSMSGSTNEKIGFNGFEIMTGYGSSGVKVFPDGDCPAGYGFALTLDTWQLGSAGELIQNDLQNGDSLDMASSSGIEFRDVFCGNLACNAPGKNGVITFA